MADSLHIANRKITTYQRKIIQFWWNLVRTPMQIWNSITATWPNIIFL